MKGKEEDRQGGPGPRNLRTLGKTQPEAWVDSTLSNNKTQTTSCPPKRHVQALVPRGSEPAGLERSPELCIFNKLPRSSGKLKQAAHR